MEIRSFEDIKRMDGELAGLFLRPDEAVSWAYAVENGIREWIGRHNKQYWEVVRFVSQQRGILGKLKKDRKTVWLKREDFARVLLKFCPDAFEEGERVSTLKTSMEHYEFAAQLHRLDRVFDAHLVRQHIREVEALLDQKPVIQPVQAEEKPTLEDLVEAYLRREVDEQDTGHFPRSRVCIRPQYGDCCPAISVETFKTEQFLAEGRPSAVEAYEFVDGELQKSKLNELIGLYGCTRIKLFVVSACGLKPDVRARAVDRGIGYVLMNPDSAMTSDSYILPRSIEDYTKRQHDLEVLEGRKPLKAPLLIMDGPRLTSSLADVLSGHGVAVKSYRLLNIPFLSTAELEARADALTKADVERRLLLFDRSKWTDADFSLDPFAYADLRGLGYDSEVMEHDSQLGRLDVGQNRVTLNATGQGNVGRYRFTMAHELGHYLLHAPLFQAQGVVSVGESKGTLSLSSSDASRLEYQANAFASFLLMPTALVECLYAYYHYLGVEMPFGGTCRPLYYSPDQRETWHSYKSIVGQMAYRLRVSKQAMEVRLQLLGLLIMS